MGEVRGLLGLKDLDRHTTGNSFSEKTHGLAHLDPSSFFPISAFIQPTSVSRCEVVR